METGGEKSDLSPPPVSLYASSPSGPMFKVPIARPGIKPKVLDVHAARGLAVEVTQLKAAPRH